VLLSCSYAFCAFVSLQQGTRAQGGVPLYAQGESWSVVLYIVAELSVIGLFSSVFSGMNGGRARDGGRKRVIPMKKSLSKHGHVEHEFLYHIKYNSDEHVTLHIMRCMSHQHSLAHRPIQHAPTSRRVSGRAFAAMSVCPRRVIIGLRPCNFISHALADAEEGRLFCF
jgi:hypothetical protein